MYRKLSVQRTPDITNFFGVPFKVCYTWSSLSLKSEMILSRYRLKDVFLCEQFDMIDLYFYLYCVPSNYLL